MPERSRRDGQPTAEEMMARGKAGVGAETDGDEAMTIDWAKVGGETPGAAVAERQADARADSAPPGGGAEKLQSDAYSYDEAKEDLQRLTELDVEQQKINAERGKIYQRMDKRGGNRGVFKSIIALGKKSAATIEAEEGERRKLFGWFIAPKIAAAASEGSEG